MRTAVLLSQYKKPRFRLIDTKMMLINRKTKTNTVISSRENGRIEVGHERQTDITG
jgi:hypothetical protein